MTRAALYLRVSTKKQDVEAQREALQRYAGSQGWDAELYEDGGRSGRHDRDVHERMVQDALARKVEVVVYSKISRAHRHLSHFLRDWLRLEQAGVRRVYVMDGLDSQGPFATGIATLLAELAQMESERHGEDIAALARRKRASAATLGQRAIWGRRRRDGTPGRLSTEADRMAVRERRARGETVRQIAADLGLGKTTVATLSKSSPLPTAEAPREER